VHRNNVRIAVLSGSVEEAELRAAGVDAHRLLVAPDARSARLLVVSGEADALLLSAPTVRWMASQDGGRQLQVCDGFIESAPVSAHTGAFGFRKSSPRLLTAWNRALQSLVGTPEHLRLVSPFGFTPAELPH
jgi:polar amino acid transport system substrate-binding protein